MQGPLDAYTREIGIASNRLDEVLDTVLDLEYLSVDDWGPLQTLVIVREAVTRAAHVRFTQAHGKLESSIVALQEHVRDVERALSSLRLTRDPNDPSIHEGEKAVERLWRDWQRRKDIVSDLATQRDRDVLLMYQDYFRLSKTATTSTITAATATATPKTE
jgi:hypothetical protein